MYWGARDETDGTAENGMVRVVPFRSLLGYDNLDVSGCFLQEEKYVSYCFSEQ